MPLILALLGCPFVSNADIEEALDRDADGFKAAVHGGDDCDDGNASRYPGAPDPWYDGVILDCNRTDDFDADLDGFPRDQDCDDEDPEVAEPTAWYVDGDLDSAGAGGALVACDPGPGWADNDGDCDDDNSNLHPLADERCNGVDDDCDGFIDDDDPDVDPIGFITTWEDIDGDGVGSGDASRACIPPAGWADSGDDCDDNDPNNRPRAFERCDGVDNDCDGLIDADDDNLDPDEATWYFDDDGDGWGDTNSPAPILRCLGNPDESNQPGDCDDKDDDRYPTAPERCDGIDNDCDGLRDEADPDAVLPVWYLDSDGDGVGDSQFSAAVCLAPPDYVPVGEDCDDTDPDVGGPVDYLEDQDLDGYGSGVPVSSCSVVPGLINQGGDCNDENDQIHPGQTDPPYDGVDQDCSGTSDFDADADGQDSADYGGLDCDDADPDTYDGAPERFYDGVDQDCRGGSDYDADVDGQDAEAFGGTDCDDLDPIAYLGAPEIFGDGIDQDCGIFDDLDVDMDGMPDVGDCVASGLVRVPGDYADLASAILAVPDCTEIVLASGDWPAVDLDVGTRRLLVRSEQPGVRLIGETGHHLFLSQGTIVLAGLDAVGGASLVDATAGRVAVSDVLYTDNDDLEYPLYHSGVADIWLRYSSFVNTSGVMRIDDGAADIEGLDVTGSDQFYVLRAANADLVIDGLTIVDSEGTTALYVTDSAVDIRNVDMHDNELDPFSLYDLSGVIDNVSVVNHIFQAGNMNIQGTEDAQLLVRDLELSRNFFVETPFSDRVFFIIQTDIDGLTMVGNSFTARFAQALALSTDTRVEGLVFMGNVVDTGIYCYVPADVSQATIVGNSGDAIWGDGQCRIDHSIVAYNGGYGLIEVPGVRYTDIYGNLTGDFLGMVNPVGVDGNVAVDPAFLTFDDGLPPAYVDVHLRATSPLRDAGDPARSDVDGSIADLGAYGGPNGEDDQRDDDGDGMPDGWERRTGLDPSVDDGPYDLDGDELDNLTEFLLGTRPDVADTDADLVVDLFDDYPLDADQD